MRFHRSFYSNDRDPLRAAVLLVDDASTEHLRRHERGHVVMVAEEARLQPDPERATHYVEGRFILRGENHRGVIGDGSLCGAK